LNTLDVDRVALVRSNEPRMTNSMRRERGEGGRQEWAIALAKRLQQYWPAARFWTEPLDERFPKIGTYEVQQQSR
jgi:hypothetical protein